MTRGLVRSICGALVLVTLGACAPAGPKVQPAAKGLAACRNPDVPYEISYPAAWYTNAGDDPCRHFDRAPVRFDPGRDPETAINIVVEQSDLEGYLRELVGPAQDVVERRRIEISGKRAYRLRLRATRDASLVTPGTRTTAYAVDLGGSVLVVRTVGRPGTLFEGNETVLDQMVFTLRLR